MVIIIFSKWSISCRYDYNFSIANVLCRFIFHKFTPFITMTAFSHSLTPAFHEDFFRSTDRFARTTCPFPRCFAADEQTMIVRCRTAGGFRTGYLKQQ